MIFVSVVLLTSSLLGLDTNFSVTSSKPKIAIVDMGGGGGYTGGTEKPSCARLNPKC